MTETKRCMSPECDGPVSRHCSGYCDWVCKTEHAAQLQNEAMEASIATRDARIKELENHIQTLRNTTAEVLYALTRGGNPVRAVNAMADVLLITRGAAPPLEERLQEVRKVMDPVVKSIREEFSAGPMFLPPGQTDMFLIFRVRRSECRRILEVMD